MGTVSCEPYVPSKLLRIAESSRSDAPIATGCKVNFVDARVEKLSEEMCDAIAGPNRS